MAQVELKTNFLTPADDAASSSLSPLPTLFRKENPGTSRSLPVESLLQSASILRYLASVRPPFLPNSSRKTTKSSPASVAALAYSSTVPRPEE